ncbi:TRAFAC clade GTPase domain-containing protein [Corynebacterium sp. 335C]
MTVPAPVITRCPHTFRPLADPASRTSEHAGGRELPMGWEDSGTICISLAGARNSGKSFYIAVLVKQLERLCTGHRRTMRPADANTRDVYREHYETPLYHEMGLIQSTPSSDHDDAYQREPLIFDIGRWDVDGRDRNWFVVIRDVAGEDLERPDVDAESLGFFSYSDAIVFLFDPLKVPQVTNYLRGLVDPQELGGDPLPVLQNLIRVLHRPGARDAFAAAPPRMCVALSKFDTLQELQKVEDNEWSGIMSNYGAAYRRDVGLDYDERDGMLLDAEIRSMLLRLRADDIVNTVENLYRDDPGSEMHRYFAVSALGAAPTGTHLHRNGIAPYRVLDPLLWIFNRKGVFRPQEEMYR